jgi:hypothetical protein
MLFRYRYVSQLHGGLYCAGGGLGVCFVPISGQCSRLPPTRDQTIPPTASTPFSFLSLHPTMSQAQSAYASTSPSNFQSIFNAALKAYEKKIKNDLLAHPLAAQFQACKSPGDILAVIPSLPLTTTISWCWSPVELTNRATAWHPRDLFCYTV